MEDFLIYTIESLRSTKDNKITIVLGNESCDLDSAVSALVYAAFLHWEYNQIKCKVCTRYSREDENINASYKDDIFVPVLNVDRNDFQLKTEVSYCLREHGIDASKLIFRNDFNLEELMANPKSAVVLVDHHVLAKKDLFLTPLVTEIIDHRPVDKKNWKFNEDTRITIELVGSCASLVTNRMRTLGTMIAKEGDFFNAYPSATDLLHCSILLDTVNFSKEVNKATPLDREAVEYLESILHIENVVDERKKKLDRLVKARNDVSQLTANELLRKDVKISGDNILVPSFPILVEEFLQKPKAFEAVSEELKLRNCYIALLLGMSLTAGLKRDAAVYCPTDHDAAVKLATFLQDWKEPSLELASSELPYAKTCIYFQQLNLSASRKQYMPAVIKFLENSSPCTLKSDCKDKAKITE